MNRSRSKKRSKKHDGSDIAEVRSKESEIEEIRNEEIFKLEIELLFVTESQKEDLKSENPLNYIIFLRTNEIKILECKWLRRDRKFFIEIIIETSFKKGKVKNILWGSVNFNNTFYDNIVVGGCVIQKLQFVWIVEDEDEN